MKSDKVVVSHDEVERITASSPPVTAPITALPSPIPLAAKLALSALVICLPLLCIVSIILRVALRGQPVRVRLAWVNFMSTLLIVSSVLSTAAAVMAFSFVPSPLIAADGLPELDERASFPALPSPSELPSAAASATLKPLVVVFSPSIRLWNRQQVASSSFGAGFLVKADRRGYLFVTANHVIKGGSAIFGAQNGHAMIAGTGNLWSSADVVAVSEALDLALLWVPRQAGLATFVQPVSNVRDGEAIYVIGHPEGFRYTLSTGIVSGVRGDAVQISAPISPGNSGGPVYDDRGNVIAIVDSKFDRAHDPNGENLGFAVRAMSLLDPSVWTFRGKGAAIFDDYIKAEQALTKLPATHDVLQSQ